MENAAEFAKIYYPIIITVLGIAIGVIGTLLGVLWNQHTAKEKEQDTDIKEIRNEMKTEFKKLPYDYVLKDDFIRAMTGLEMKMDAVSKDVKDLRTEIIEVIKGLGGGEAHGQ